MTNLKLLPFTLLLAGPALADTGTQIGTLTDVQNFIVYTEQDFDCRFEPNDGQVTPLRVASTRSVSTSR